MSADIDDLQVRLAFQEDMLEALNLRVAEQQTQIDQLNFQLNYLNQKIRDMADKGAGSPNIMDEKPPHY